MKLTGLTWRKSRYSANEVNCVEIANLPHGDAAVRDSKDPLGTALVIGRAQWGVFVDSAAGRGQFG